MTYRPPSTMTMSLSEPGGFLSEQNLMWLVIKYFAPLAANALELLDFSPRETQGFIKFEIPQSVLSSGPVGNMSDGSTSSGYEFRFLTTTMALDGSGIMPTSRLCRCRAVRY